VYSTKTNDGSILLTDVGANQSRILVNGSDVTDVSLSSDAAMNLMLITKQTNGNRLPWNDFKVSPDSGVVLFSAGKQKVCF
jgi:hypothetical protein